jgi:hypothetical protein
MNERQKGKVGNWRKSSTEAKEKNSRKLSVRIADNQAETRIDVSGIQVATTTDCFETDIACRGPAAHSTYIDGKGLSVARFLSRLGSAIGPLSGKPIGRINGKNTQGAVSLLSTGRPNGERFVLRRRPHGIRYYTLKDYSGLINGALNSCSGYLCKCRYLV